MLSDREIQDLFRQEGLERIESLEACLLAYEANSNKAEANDSIFRDLHTLKGSGNMAGFVSLGSYVHALESSLEPYHRTGVFFDKATVSRFLEVADILRDLIYADPGAKKIPSLGFGDLVAPSKTASVAMGKNDSPQVSDSPKVADGPLQSWLIHLEPAPNTFREGISIKALLDSLKVLGAVQVQGNQSNLPGLSELDPESCFLEWDILLKTSAPKAHIEDAFSFLPLGSVLEINLQANAKVANNDMQEPNPAKNPGPSRPPIASVKASDSASSIDKHTRGLLCQAGDLAVLIPEDAIKACRPPEKEIKRPMGIALIDDQQLTVIDVPSIFGCPVSSERVLVIVESEGEEFCLALNSFADFIEGPIHNGGIQAIRQTGVAGFVIDADNAIVQILDITWFREQLQFQKQDVLA